MDLLRGEARQRTGRVLVLLVVLLLVLEPIVKLLVVGT